MNDGAIAFALLAVAVIGWAYAFAMATELKRVRKQLAAFDHDGDGKIGGSKPRRFLHSQNR